MRWLPLVVVLAACGGGNAVCTGRQIACGDSCVDPELDAQHCGGCGHACEVGQVCSAAVCADDCIAGTTDCSGRCVETQEDPNNCGTCGHSCGGGVCSAGACQSTCGVGEACDGRCVDTQTDPANCGACGTTCARGQLCEAGACTTSAIEHVVLIVEENHTFDTYFGNYCQATAGSAPTCTSGPSCCEAAPALDPSGASPIVLDDASNETYDRDHDRVCEVAQIDGGLMDHFVVGSNVHTTAVESLYTWDCSDPHNWALADATTMTTYWSYADAGALADRYFQPAVGSTSANDMYLAAARWQFDDNTDRPLSIGSGCLGPGGNAALYNGVATIGDLLVGHGLTFRMYADGYADAVASAPLCASQAGHFPGDCEVSEQTAMYSTCNYDPSDLPFQYYKQFVDDPTYIVDEKQLGADINDGKLPNLVYIKPRTYTNEHPKWSTISRGVGFVSTVVDMVRQSQYANSTLILIVWDEGGGFFDHVSPPPAVATMYDADASGAPVPYGTRVPLLALGPFARAGVVSHVQLEHSSIVRFLEHNFLGAHYAGALGHRDAVVQNLGSLLDPAKTKITIP